MESSFYTWWGLPFIPGTHVVNAGVNLHLCTKFVLDEPIRCAYFLYQGLHLIHDGVFVLYLGPRCTHDGIFVLYTSLRLIHDGEIGRAHV